MPLYEYQCKKFLLYGRMSRISARTNHPKLYGGEKYDSVWSCSIEAVGAKPGDK